MATKRPSLGRGLEALLGNINTANTHSANNGDDSVAVATPIGLAGGTSVRMAPRNEELAHLPVDLLQRGRYQPRLDMRPESLQELADSIKAQGVVQPIVVRPVGEALAGQARHYE